MRNAIRTAVFSLAVTGFATAANAQAMQFFAVLDGGHEVSAGGDAAAGDLNGFGTASVLLGVSGQLCFSLLVRGINTPSAAHIHENKAGVNGPVVVTLTPLPAGGNPGTSAGCVNGIDPAVIARIRANPGRFYVNVHNGAFAGGAIRGQLF
jgi:hypothetical protein